MVRESDRTQVFVGGTLVGEFGPGDAGVRNLLVVSLAADPRAHLGHLADAFELSAETVRLLRRQHEAEGAEALLRRQHGGARTTKVTPARRTKLEALFAQGVSIDAALDRVGARWGIGRSTVGRVHAEWAERTRAARPAADPDAQLPLVSAATEPVRGAASPRDAETEPVIPTAGALDGVAAAAPATTRHVQHAGAWALLGTVAAMGLYEQAEALRAGRVPAEALRVALDATVVALGVGEGCVEGVRRLATPTAPALLRAAHAPSATWVRRVLHRFAGDAASTWLHLRMAGAWIREATEGEAVPAVFYVDNHLRRYTGQRVVRRGWRMQDKRVVPGASDFCVHNEDGRPVLRLHAPDNPPLTSVLGAAAALLRAALGPAQRVLLAFDRGGAYPAQMASLRDEGFDFVTYERRPYALLAAGAFERAVELDGAVYGLHDTRKNLGGGRGRVRRVAVRTPEGRQVNLLATSELPAERLLAVMHGRWGQENGLKHGVERWGLNQLDGRATEPYDPDTVVPNPARRRLDHALRIARAGEGDARNQLARLSASDPKRARVEAELAESLRRQAQLLAQRPATPARVELRDSELADELVKHEPAYKLLVDTVRIACANAESELAAAVGAHLRKPQEAKRVLRNLFLAPGDVWVTPTTLTVRLAPAGTSTELNALAELLAELTRRRLALPGDRPGRRLRFRLQT